MLASLSWPFVQLLWHLFVRPDLLSQSGLSDFSCFGHGHLYPLRLTLQTLALVDIEVGRPVEALARFGG